MFEQPLVPPSLPLPSVILASQPVLLQPPPTGGKHALDSVADFQTLTVS